MSEGPTVALVPAGGIEAFNKRIRELEAEVNELRRRVFSTEAPSGNDEALRTLDERQRLAVDAGAVGLWDWDIRNDRVVCSERVYQFHGLNPSAFGGTSRDFQRMIHAEDAERVGAATTAALQADEPYDVEFRVVQPGGEIRWLASKAKVIRDSQGGALRMVGATQDITAARQAQQELLRLQSAALHMAAIVESSDDAIVSKDLNGIIKTWNRGAERIFGYTAEEAIGRPVVMLIPQDRQQEEPEILRRLQRGERVDHFETIRRHKDGTLVNISLTISPVRDPSGRIVGASKVARDITEQKRTEADRERADRDMRRANQDLETFAYSASHDLQEPLRMIAISAQLLERKAGDLSEENRHFLKNILEGAGRMRTLLEDLLSYTRATRQGEGPVPVLDCGKVLDDVLRHLKPLLDLDHAKVVSSPLPLLAVHEVHLTQLFQNLIGNALKYRRSEDPYVQISATASEGCAIISVSDNGLGIDPRFGEQIFGLFKRLHTREEYPGSGIGLAICKRIVEQYGGRIWLERSAPGAGSVFCFSLPIQPEAC